MAGMAVRRVACVLVQCLLACAFPGVRMTLAFRGSTIEQVACESSSHRLMGGRACVLCILLRTCSHSGPDMLPLSPCLSTMTVREQIIRQTSLPGRDQELPPNTHILFAVLVSIHHHIGPRHACSVRGGVEEVASSVASFILPSIAPLHTMVMKPFSSFMKGCHVQIVPAMVVFPGSSQLVPRFFPGSAKRCSLQTLCDMVDAR